MAMLKITTLFLGAFFCCVVAPSYIKAEKPELLTAGGMSYLTHPHSKPPTNNTKSSYAASSPSYSSPT